MRGFKALKMISLQTIFLSLAIPLVMICLWSVADRWPWPDIFPADLSQRGWMFLVGSKRVLKVLATSILLSSVVTVLTLVICIPAARVLALYEFKGKKLIEILTLLPLIVPMMTVVMGIHVNFIRLNLANTFLGVVLVHILPGIPYGVRIMQTSFQLYGKSMEEQGRILGADNIQVFRYITVPLLKPGLIVSATMIYIISFSQYFITMLIGGGRIMTFSMLYFPYVQSGDRTITAVLSLVFLGSILLVLFVSNRLIGSYLNTTSRYLN